MLKHILTIENVIFIRVRRSCIKRAACVTRHPRHTCLKKTCIRDVHKTSWCFSLGCYNMCNGGKKKKHFKYFMFVANKFSAALGADVQGWFGGSGSAKHSVSTNKIVKSKVHTVNVLFLAILCNNEEEKGTGNSSRRVDDKRATCDILEIQRNDDQGCCLSFFFFFFSVLLIKRPIVFPRGSREWISASNRGERVTSALPFMSFRFRLRRQASWRFKRPECVTCQV